MARSHLLRLPRPKTFLYLMSLRTGTELITLCHAINKLTGLYGLLAIFTGLHLSSLQLSMYIYSLVALGLTVTLAPSIRSGPKQPLQIVALAWLYLIDSIINAAYTAAFGVGWFLVLARHTAPSPSQGGKAPMHGPGDEMIDDTAGFTDPEYNVSRVDVHGNSPPGQAAELVPHPASEAAAQDSKTALQDTILQSGSVASMTVIAVLWMIRVYFILIVLAYARACLRQYIAETNMHSTGYMTPATPSKPVHTSENGEYADNPFSEGRQLGEGWKGKLGRIMTSVGHGYWLGADGAEPVGMEEWERFGREETRVRAMNKDREGERERSRAEGLGERERRRRAGTDPPILRPIELENIKAGR